MLQLIIFIILAVFIIKMIKKSGNKPESIYEKTPPDTKMTFEEWESLSDGAPLSATKEEWQKLDKEEKITKEEYEKKVLYKLMGVQNNNDTLAER